MSDIQLHPGRAQAGVALPFDNFDIEGSVLPVKAFGIHPPASVVELAIQVLNSATGPLAGAAAQTRVRCFSIRVQVSA